MRGMTDPTPPITQQPTAPYPAPTQPHAAPPATQPAAQWGPNPTQPAAQPRRRRTGLIVALAALAGLVIAAGIAVPLWLAHQPTDGKAIRACRADVIDLLRSPATAQWPGGESVHLHRGGVLDGITEVVGQVDAQNEFGALIRGGWKCSTVWRGDYFDVLAASLDSQN